MAGPQHEADGFAHGPSGLRARPSALRQACGCTDYDPVNERLEYDYAYDEAKRGSKQPTPRIRVKGEPYLDSFNGEPWRCSFGTGEDNGTWMNSGDQAGTIMAALVWLLMLYSAATITLLTITEGVNPILGMGYCTLVALALASHAKTSLSDPGSVPRSAVPMETQRRDSTSHSMCGQCQTFKPPMSHHCRICNRCVSRMDHHCESKGRKTRELGLRLTENDGMLPSFVPGLFFLATAMATAMATATAKP